MGKHEFDEIDKEIGRIKVLYKRALQKDSSHGSRSLEKGKLLERLSEDFLLLEQERKELGVEDFIIVELNFDITEKNLNRLTYELVRSKLEPYF